VNPCFDFPYDLGPDDVIVSLPMFLIFIRHSNGISSSSSESESLLNTDATFGFLRGSFLAFTLLVFNWIDKAGFFSGIKDDDDDDDDVDDFEDDSSDLRFKFDEVELVCDVVLPELA